MDAKTRKNRMVIDRLLDENPNYVVTLCYDEALIFSSLKSALQFYKIGIWSCEGAERDRYVNIVMKLMDGMNVVNDTGSYSNQWNYPILDVKIND